MPGPTTEYLAEQLDRVREEVSATARAVQEARREAIDGRRELGDTFADELKDIREHIGGELVKLRNEVATGREALKMDQTVIREDMVRLQAQTGELIARFDRALGFLKALLITLIGVGVTVVGAMLGAFWNASRVYHAVEDHGRRIERIEAADEGRAKLQQSIDRLQQTLNGRATGVEKSNGSR